MRIATWNVNSIRARAGRVVDWLVREDIDVLAMQEIKCKPEQFPAQMFEDAGYELVIHGFSQWNGVAFASREPMTDVATSFPDMPGFLKGEEGPGLPQEARALGVTVADLRLWSLYVPNGRSLGDPHYEYKLDWLTTLKEYAADALSAEPGLALALMGDWNVAPFDHDQNVPGLIEGLSTHISPRERAAFHAIEGVGLRDVVRPLVPEGLFTYWDYKQLAFPRNEGMRIDFILASEAFAELVTDASIHRNERKGVAPSDHVPVVVDLDIPGDNDDRPMIF
ncbi:MAG: xth [Cryobacterium sp.]|jgi:exodeoxyribonuclease-3|nr:xth [Cryobacterium sp.]